MKRKLQWTEEKPDFEAFERPDPVGGAVGDETIVASKGEQNVKKTKSEGGVFHAPISFHSCRKKTKTLLCQLN